MVPLEVYDNILSDSPGTRAWLSIDATTRDRNPFLTLAWARSWLRAYRDVDSSLLLRERRNGTETLLPLMKWHGELRSLCYNAADYTGCIRASGAEVELLDIPDLLMGSARERPTILWNVAEADPAVAALRRRGALSVIGVAAMHFVDLDAVRSDPHRWIRMSATRRQAHRDLRRLLRDGARLECGVPTNALDLDELVRLHTAEWQFRGEPGKFADVRRREFVEYLVNSGVELFVSTLRVGKTLLAYRLGMLSATRLHCWNCGFNVGYSSHGPGSALLVGELLHVARQTSLGVVDFLRGNEPYKRSYMSGTSYVYTVQVKCKH